MKLALVLLLVFTACGPEKTAREKEKEQIEENTRKMREELAPLVGTYLGLFIRDNGTSEEASLELAPMTLLISNPGRNETSEVPTLGGSLKTCFKPNSCFKNGDESFVFHVAQFSAAKYDSGTQQLLLYQPGTTESVSIEAKTDGQILQGRVYSGSRLHIGTLDLRKTK